MNPQNYSAWVSTRQPLELGAAHSTAMKPPNRDPAICQMALRNLSVISTYSQSSQGVAHSNYYIPHSGVEFPENIMDAQYSP